MTLKDLDYASLFFEDRPIYIPGKGSDPFQTNDTADHSIFNQDVGVGQTIVIEYFIVGKRISGNAGNYSMAGVFKGEVIVSEVPGAALDIQDLGYLIANKNVTAVFPGTVSMSNPSGNNFSISVNGGDDMIVDWKARIRITYLTEPFIGDENNNFLVNESGDKVFA